MLLFRSFLIHLSLPRFVAEIYRNTETDKQRIPHHETSSTIIVEQSQKQRQTRYL